nr:DUF402 domain-containing protein [Paenibacillus soyae]
MKRKFGNRADWKRVLNREYAQAFVESSNFTGYITLLKIHKVENPLYVEYHGEKICIADDGYQWLQQFPYNCNHSVTTMFDSQGRIIQWYIDISAQNGVDDNQIPWMDDLYLDLIVLPTGELVEKDSGELEDAFRSGVINKELFDMAWEEFRRVRGQIERVQFPLLKLSVDHRQILLQRL